MSYFTNSNYDGLHGSILMCEDCERPTVHFTAPGGVPVCGFCGATPAEGDGSEGGHPGSRFSSFDPLDDRARRRS
jgi:hypothetical protein